MFVTLRKQAIVETPSKAANEPSAQGGASDSARTPESSKTGQLANATGSLTSVAVTGAGTTTSPTNATKPVEATSTSGAPLLPVAKLIPRAEDVRAEVAKNPHGTPEALVRLSVSLGDRLDALKTESEASGFLDELDECVMKPAVATTSDVKTLCLLNAKRVGEKFPVLESKFAGLEKRAPEKVREALEFLK